jgi:flagellar motor component MotA
MPAIYSVGLLVLISIAAMLFNIPIMSMLNVRSLAVVVAMSSVMLAFSCGWNTVQKTISSFFAFNTKDEEIPKVVVCLQTLILAIQASAAIVCVIGIIHVMRNLDRPDVIGPGVASCITGYLYGVFFSILIVMPWRSYLLRRSNLEKRADLSSYSLAALPVIGGIFGVVLYAIMK